MRFLQALTKALFKVIHTYTFLYALLAIIYDIFVLVLLFLYPKQGILSSPRNII